MSDRSSPSNARRPVGICSRQPKAQTSLRLSASRSPALATCTRRCQAVPRGHHGRRRDRRRCRPSGNCRTLRLPCGRAGVRLQRAELGQAESSTFTVPSGRNLMLAGLRSRWMIPCSWAASVLPRSPSRWAVPRRRLAGPAQSDRRGSVPRRAPSAQRVHAGRFLETVDRRDVRMIERREELRFAPEARQPIGVDCKELGEESSTRRRAGASRRAHDRPRPCRLPPACR